MIYHRPTIKRELFTPTHKQRGGPCYLMVEYDGTMSKWGPRVRTEAMAIVRAMRLMVRFPRVVVMRDKQAVPVWDSHDGIIIIQ